MVCGYGQPPAHAIDRCSAHDSDAPGASWRRAASISDWPIIQSDAVDSDSIR